MRMLKLTVLSCAVAISAFIVTNCSAESAATSEQASSSRFSSASFEYSASSEEPVLQVTLIATYGPRERPVTEVYGDGTFVFKTVVGTTVVKEQQGQISPDQIQKVLRLAVDHGLAEWDLTRVHAQQIEKNNGKLYPIPADSSKTRVEIRLQDYERGTVRKSPLRVDFEFHGADQAHRRFPPILEIEGIIAIQQYLYQLQQDELK